MPGRARCPWRRRILFGRGAIRSIVRGVIGIFGGTFDPIHCGHLILARDALEQLGLSQILFIPAAISPHKLDRGPRASAADRWAMLEAAIAGEPAFAADDCELRRDGPSYAIDTVEALRARWPAEMRPVFLIGADNVAELSAWHRIEELRKRVQFAVFRRRLPASEEPAESPFPALDRVIDISATDIRMRVASGRSIRYLVPEAVAEMIDARQLYRPPGGAAPSVPKP